METGSKFSQGSALLRDGSSVGWPDRDGAIHAGEKGDPFFAENRAGIIEKKTGPVLEEYQRQLRLPVLP